MTRRERAVDFLQRASSGQVREAYDAHVAPHFVHHNQYFPGDRESLLVAMEEASRKTPNKTLHVRHAYEAGATVVTHSHVVRAIPGDPGIAVVHIFRFEGEKIAELWDIGQPIDKNSPNANGMF